MNNITDYNEFKSKRTLTPEQVNEGAQLFDDNVWKVRTRVEIPTSLINAYVKKVQAEMGEDPRKKWSEQEIAEELTKYVTTAFLTVENLPSSIVSAAQKQPTIQSQEEMPTETQVQTSIEEAPAAQAPAAQGAQAPAQGAQAPAQGAQAVASQVAQAPAQGAQAPAQTSEI
jgi:FtsZ-interacting cell division protein ZipA